MAYNYPDTSERVQLVSVSQWFGSRTRRNRVEHQSHSTPPHHLARTGLTMPCLQENLDDLTHHFLQTGATYS